MLWLTCWVAVLGVGALALVAAVNSLRFGRRVGREAREMWALSAGQGPLERGGLDGLPAPVRRYLSRAIGGRRFAVRSARLRHGGTFRPKLDGDWLPIRGEQYFATDPPGFVWWGRSSIVPGLWVEARDRSLRGAGNMLVLAESTVILADAVGPELDQGALLRLLAEMVWFPTALLDDRYLAWTPLDERAARATLRVEGREATGLFEFGEEGLPTRVSADRYRDLGGGKAVLTPWFGECADYREVDGLLVPHLMTAYWHVAGRSIPYARFAVERMEYDVPVPF